MDQDTLNEFTRFIEWEKSPKWTLLDLEGTSVDDLDTCWLNALSGRATAKQRVAALWSNIADVMPRSKIAFEEKIFGLSLLKTNESNMSLVYFFESKGELSVRRGYAPVSSLPPIADLFPVDLRPFYAIHDGLINFMSYDDGPLPVKKWRNITIPGSVAPSFVEIAVDGSEGFGFDVSESPCKAYVISPDSDEVELVTDVWEYLDNLVACRIENM